MKITLIAIGKHMPSWVVEGYEEYAKRLPAEMSLKLIEINAGKRTKGCDIAKLIHKEGEQMLAAIPIGNRVVALEVTGKMWDTPKLSLQLQKWREESRDIALLIGGPEGLAPACLEKAELRWSLSPLTLPHPLVRIIVAEQLYRAWSIICGHPYHR